jgi:hypothetical protein
MLDVTVPLERPGATTVFVTVPMRVEGVQHALRIARGIVRVHARSLGFKLGDCDHEALCSHPQFCRFCGAGLS